MPLVVWQCSKEYTIAKRDKICHFDRRQKSEKIYKFPGVKFPYFIDMWLYNYLICKLKVGKCVVKNEKLIKVHNVNRE